MISRLPVTGNIFAFCPMTAKAKKALENIQYEDWQMFGGSLMIPTSIMPVSWQTT